MTKENKEKLFTQAEVDAIIKERLDRERKRYTGDADTIEMLRNELTVVRSELAGIKADNVAKAEALKAEQVHRSIISELEKVNSINPTELYQLFVGGTSVNDNGEAVYTNDTGETVPLNEHIKAWAYKSPWAIKNMQQPGSGVGGGHPIDGHAALRNAFNLNE